MGEQPSRAMLGLPGKAFPSTGWGRRGGMGKHLVWSGWQAPRTQWETAGGRTLPACRGRQPGVWFLTGVSAALRGAREQSGGLEVERGKERKERGRSDRSEHTCTLGKYLGHLLNLCKNMCCNLDWLLTTRVGETPRNLPPTKKSAAGKVKG